MKIWLPLASQIHVTIRDDDDVMAARHSHPSMNHDDGNLVAPGQPNPRNDGDDDDVMAARHSRPSMNHDDEVVAARQPYSAPAKRKR